jgi:hypothetical protein
VSIISPENSAYLQAISHTQKYLFRDWCVTSTSPPTMQKLEKLAVLTYRLQQKTHSVETGNKMLLEDSYSVNLFACVSV